MSKLFDVYILLTEDNRRYKIIKIVPESDGGFAILTPYHKSNSGALLKMPIDYTETELTEIVFEECISYTASDKVKLSIHHDGFVQFSGINSNTIISGRDPITKEPKGLGIKSQPLSNPVKTGPTFGVTVWGLSDFKTFQKDRDRDKIITFNNSTYYNQQIPSPDDMVPNTTAYLIEGFVIPYSYWNRVSKIGDHYLIKTNIPNRALSGQTIILRAIPQNYKDYFIALLASRIKMRPTAPSGFTLGGPSQFTDREHGKAVELMAVYPNDLENVSFTGSLDYIRAASDAASSSQ